jgi:hypothetical protein
LKGEPILNSDQKLPSMQHNLTVESLSQAIFIVNRHAKTAPNPGFLYKLKHEALIKLMEEGKAQKIGLHFSENPKNSKQQSDVLVECGRYTFHIPPTKKDFHDLPHLGKLDCNVRNPKASLSLNIAKAILLSYTGMKEHQVNNDQKRNQRAYQKPIFKKLGERY